MKDENQPRVPVGFIDPLTPSVFHGVVKISENHVEIPIVRKKCTFLYLEYIPLVPKGLFWRRPIYDSVYNKKDSRKYS